MFRRSFRWFWGPAPPSVSKGCFLSTHEAYIPFHFSAKRWERSSAHASSAPGGVFLPFFQKVLREHFFPIWRTFENLSPPPLQNILQNVASIFLGPPSFFTGHVKDSFLLISIDAVRHYLPPRTGKHAPFSVLPRAPKTWYLIPIFSPPCSRATFSQALHGDPPPFFFFPPRASLICKNGINCSLFFSSLMSFFFFQKKYSLFSSNNRTEYMDPCQATRTFSSLTLRNHVTLCADYESGFPSPFPSLSIWEDFLVERQGRPPPRLERVPPFPHLRTVVAR